MEVVKLWPATVAIGRLNKSLSEWILNPKLSGRVAKMVVRSNLFWVSFVIDLETAIASILSFSDNRMVSNYSSKLVEFDQIGRKTTFC